MAARRRARELALRVLFAAEGGGSEPGAALTHAAAAMAADAATRRLAERLVQGVLAEGPAIDRRLAAASDHWPLDQMAQVERTILRMAAFEMGPSSSTPVRVAINEAVELAKVYAGGDAARFVNGVLGHLAATTPVAAAGAEDDAGPAGR